jgi:hypothetical protein
MDYIRIDFIYPHYIEQMVISGQETKDSERIYIQQNSEHDSGQNQLLAACR